MMRMSFSDFVFATLRYPFAAAVIIKPLYMHNKRTLLLTLECDSDGVVT